MSKLPHDKQREIARRGAAAVNAVGQSFSVSKFLADPLSLLNTSGATADRHFTLWEKCPAAERERFLGMIAADPVFVAFIKAKETKAA